jgi:sugar/nucleoside kinase (ribokinase family)
MSEGGQFDILSVGDIVTDAFIKLYDDQAQVVKDNQGSPWLAMPFGTKLPFDHVEVAHAVGNASNAAVSFARLGLNTGFVTNVGGDAEGREMIASLHKDKVDTRLVRINHDKPSNYHYVLWYKEERTILIKHVEYDYDWPHLRRREIPRWIYFSSISENALEYHDELAEWLEDHMEVQLAFQPGTFQMKAGAKRLSKFYKRTAVLILNREEAVLVGGGKHDDIHDLFDKLHHLGPRIVVITDGPKGAYASDGIQRWSMPLYPDPAPPKERTGAGDAFASTLVAALAKGMSLEDALRWAPINSMNVVQHVGAQEGLLPERKLLELLHHAPKTYHPKPLK